MITCHQYDAIEVLCMYQYPIELTMKNGDVLQGNALDTRLNKDREECIKLAIKGDDVLVLLSEISTVDVCISPAPLPTLFLAT